MFDKNFDVVDRAPQTARTAAGDDEEGKAAPQLHSDSEDENEDDDDVKERKHKRPAWVDDDDESLRYPPCSFLCVLSNVNAQHRCLLSLVTHSSSSHHQAHHDCLVANSRELC